MVEVKKISLCAQCVQALNDNDLFMDWEHICKRTGLYKKYFFFVDDEECSYYPVDKLEKLGYVISTEIDKHTLIVKPRFECKFRNGTNEEIFYCAKPSEHLEDCND